MKFDKFTLKAQEALGDRAADRNGKIEYRSFAAASFIGTLKRR